jgi:endonuclease/exonuclease/phosphatase family metal-dependent hydrolase
MTSHERLPILMGGDFNILRHAHEKNNENFDGMWPFLFNCVIDGLNLRELEMSGRRYTWANSLPNPTYEKLDRILMSTEWELNHPLSTVVALPRVISDHTPYLLIPENHLRITMYPCSSLNWVGYLEMVLWLW